MARQFASKLVHMSDIDPKDVDAYIAAAPKSAQPMLRRLRKIIKAAAPQAQERISYRMPYYDLNGRLVYFAAHTHHVGLYALGQTAELSKGPLARYVASKGTLQFPLDEPLPEAEITKLLKKRVSQNESKGRAPRSRKS